MTDYKTIILLGLIVTILSLIQIFVFMFTLPIIWWIYRYGRVIQLIFSVLLFCEACIVTAFSLERIIKPAPKRVYFTAGVSQILSDVFFFIVLMYSTDMYVFLQNYFFPRIAEILYAIFYIAICLILSPLIGYGIKYMIPEEISSSETRFPNDQYT